jgi:iron complex outermembrane receptor protein
VPLSDEWAMRVSTLRQHRDDFVDNYSDLAKTNKTGAGRLQRTRRARAVPVQAGTTFSALFNVHQRTTNGSARLFRANLIKKGTNDIADGYDLDSIVTNAQNFQNLTTNGANVRLSWDLGAVKLYSITGYEGVDNYYSRGDIDGGIAGGPGFMPFQVADRRRPDRPEAVQPGIPRRIEERGSAELAGRRVLLR